MAAGLVAGAGWALAPAAVAVGRVALGDEPAACVAALFVLATVLAAAAPAKLPEDRRRWPPAALAAAGGLSFGLLAAMRTASALLFAPVALVFAVYAWRIHGGRELLRRAWPWACGAAVAPLLVAGLLWRSGLPPWQWNGYGFWVPRWYADAGTTFNLRYALHGNGDFPRGGDGRPIPNVRFYAQVLLGWPGLASDSYLGWCWPALGWLAGALTAWRGRQRPAVAAGLVAAAAVATAHLAFYSLYFFPAARFLLAPLALPLVAAGAACGLAIAGPRPAPASRPAHSPPRRSDPLALAAGLAGAAGLAAAIVAAFLAFTAWRFESFPDQDVRASFAAWRRLPETARAVSKLPFDPLEAQALGLLPPATLQQIHAWGALPPTVHVRRLRGLGIIPP
jgi:hypothetical protein